MERPRMWRGIHTELTVVIRNLINERLPDNFALHIEGTTRIIDLDDPNHLVGIVPDLYIVNDDPIRAAQHDAVAIADPSVEIASVFPLTFEERWLEIIDRDQERVITTIEILSPFNKVGEGFDAFDEKREKVAETKSNWLEIDLFRAGKRPFFELTNCDYCAMMRRGKSHKWVAWEMDLRDPLLTIAVPLTDGYDDLPLDLQRAIETVYRDGRYWRLLKYHEDVPAPKLSAPDLAWVEKQLGMWQEKHTPKAVKP